MTTDERLENLEKGLASARRLNRWLLAAVGLEQFTFACSGFCHPCWVPLAACPPVCMPGGATLKRELL